MVKFTFTPEGVAGLYLKKYFGNVASGDDQKILGVIFQDCFNKGILETLKEVEKRYRLFYSIEKNDKFLDDMENMRERVQSA